jgi:ChrB-like protein
VLLAYRLPREPSTPRIAVWRRLKRLGVAQLLDGLVALPLDARNKEQLEWVAEQVEDAGGEATMWMGRPGSRLDEAGLIRSLQEAAANEYRQVMEEAVAARASDTVVRRRTILRLRREMRRIRLRDHFPPPEAEEARRAVDGLSRLVEATT